MINPKPNELHVKPVNKDGKPMYQVHAVGSKFSSGIKKGEHLSDTELDDFSEMGGKIRHVKESVLGGALSAVRSALRADQHKKKARGEMGSKAAKTYDKMKEELELLEMAKRGRPRKNPLPAKKSSEDDEDDYGPDTGPEADKNIQNQLKKSVDSKDTKGGAHVEFEDGKKHFVKSEHAHKVLHAMSNLKPADRAKVQDHIYKSHDNFTAVHSMLK